MYSYTVWMYDHIGAVPLVRKNTYLKVRTGWEMQKYIRSQRVNRSTLCCHCYVIIKSMLYYITCVHTRIKKIETNTTIL